MKKKIKRSKSLVTIKEFRGQPHSPAVNYGEGEPVPEMLMDMVDAYQLHPWVYAAVFAIASNFASVQYKVMMRDDKSGNEDFKHPFYKLLNFPNPFMTGYDLRESSSISLEMTGNAYWGMERDKASGEPIEIWPLPPHMMKVVASKESPVDHYLYCVGGKEIRYDYQDMIHFTYENPRHEVYGQSSVLAGRNEITTDLFAAMWNKNFFKNSGRPDAILETDETLDDDVRKRTLLAWKKMHQGVKNAHKVAILEQGTKYKPAQINQKDMDFVNQRKASREMILAIFNVPPAIVGVLEYANYANMKEQVKMFWTVLAAKIRKFEEKLSMRAAQITFRPQNIIKAQLQTVEALRPDFNVLSQTTLNFVNAGIPINSVIKALELPFEDVEGGDAPKEPGDSKPQSDEGDTDEAQESEPPQKTAKKGLAEAMAGDKLEAQKKKALVREFRWKRFEQEREKHEDFMLRKLKSYFRGQKNRVKELFEKNADLIIGNRIEKKVKDSGDIEMDMIFEYGKEVKIMQGVVARPIKKAYFDFAKRGGRQVKPNFDFNLNDPKANDFISSKVVKISQDVNIFTRESLSDEIVEQIEEAVREGYTRSETVQQIASRIDDVYDFAVEGRAMRIARTETIGASNAGFQRGLEVTGVTKKEWLETHDDKTRDSHKHEPEGMGGQVVGINEKFVSPVTGNKFDFPGDQSCGDPADFVNCRCALLPVVSDEDLENV